MSKIKIQANAIGTGVVTLTSTSGSTDRTLTLPDADDTLVGQSITDALTARVVALENALRINSQEGSK